MTAKTQLNVRISETTRGQLDELAERYGTQATARAKRENSLKIGPPNPLTNV